MHLSAPKCTTTTSLCTVAGGCRNHKAVDHEEAANRKNHLDTPQQTTPEGRCQQGSDTLLPYRSHTSMYPSWNLEPDFVRLVGAHATHPYEDKFFSRLDTDHIDRVAPYSRPGPKPRPPAVCASVYAVHAVYAVYAVYARARLALTTHTIPAHLPVQLSG